MPGQTLLDVIQQRFGVAVDPDSDGGQILNSLTPNPPLAAHELTGTADVAPLTFAPTARGVSVRAARGADALVFNLPAGPLDFTLVPPDTANPAPQVELKLLAATVPLPFLRPAQVDADGMLQPGGGAVELHLPDLLLVVDASADPPASARLAPSHDAAGAQEVTMTPPVALLGPGTVLGVGFERAVLQLDGPGEPEISAPTVEIYVAPEGLPTLALHGGGHDLRLGLGGGGLSGDFALALADGAQAAARPRFLHNLAAHLRLNHNSITLLELSGQIDLAGEIDARLGVALGDPPAELDYTLRLTLDDGWQAALTLSASGGRDYLWRTVNPSPNAANLPRDTLGAYAVFTPLLGPNLPGAGASSYVDLALGAGAAGALAASRWIRTRSITLRGGELVITHPAAGAPEAFLFFDLETELQLDAEVGGTTLLATRRPIKVRHKAIGLRLDFGSDGGAPQLQPVFDPSQGFSLDLSDPGLFEVPPPLGDILQPDAARMARENPLTFEVDLVSKADLGVVTIDRAGVRVPLDAPAAPTLTALGAHLNAGAVQGSGYLQILPSGLAGHLDASLAPPLGLRASADLRLARAHDAGTDLTLVLAGLAVDWPIPIPLANSGLGLFGILGLFGMHVERDQAPGQGALDWLVNRAAGNAADPRAWRTAAHHWALGVGAVIGTVEWGFLIHAKGMIVLELPGPRLLLLMNADILSARPPKEGTTTGRLLAVVDVEPNALTIGVMLDYEIKPLLQVRVPVEAYFDRDHPERWRLDVGGLPPRLPASARFLFGFRADGYLLIHGDGIPDSGDPMPPSPADFPIGPLHGVAVAAGIRAALTWGPESIGLYLKVAAQADVGVSFKPFVIVGKLTLHGELHLFIVSIGASAAADVRITANSFFVKAEVCGEVDFFFSVSGCVTLKLGDERIQLPPPDPLLRAVSLHSRSPALLPGSGAGQPIDGSLGDAVALTPDGQMPPDAPLPVVPIDAIPALQLEMRPGVAPGCAFFAQPIPTLLPLGPADQPLDPKQLPAAAWVRRGQRCYHYRLKTVTLNGTGPDNAPLAAPLDEGETPAVWWDRYGKPNPGDDNDVQLALLTWTPDPTPAAAEYTTSRDERAKQRWGDVCAAVAEPASMLWTFRQAALGPSRAGWTLVGSAWPDDKGAVRSAPPDRILRMVEPWRSGDPLADALLQVDPAYVYGASPLPERLLVAPHTGTALRPRIEGDAAFQALLAASRPQPLVALADAVRLVTAGGLRTVRALLFVERDVWQKGLLLLRALDAAGDPSGFEQRIDAAGARLVSVLADLPRHWSDAASPWMPAVDAIRNAWFQVFVARLHEPALVLVEAELPTSAAQVELGLIADVQAPTPTWGLLIVEGLTEAELARYSFDVSSRQSKITVVAGALHGDEGKRALLRPGSTYTVAVSYDVAVTGLDDTGQPDGGAAVLVPDQVQHFRFQTQADPPARLDPWVMATDPAPAEDFFFYGDPLRVVFAHNAVRKLYRAYGRALHAVVKAASGKHPPAGPGLDPFRVSLANTVVPPQGLSALVETPFESALRAAIVDQPCVDANRQTDRHERITLTMKLEPLTDYILDLEAQPAVGDPSYPLFRRRFSTSRYASMPALAAATFATPLRHRRLADPSALLSLSGVPAAGPVQRVEDDRLEQALRAARWGELARPSTPRLTVIWKDGAPPQPIALLLETPEPLWRSRGVPREVQDGQGTKRYQLVPQTWLDVVETPPAAPLVARLVHSTDGGRTLAVLTPNARGGTLSLALRRTHHPLFEGNAASTTAALVAAVLTAAPWEELP